jgi:hypothetical protein
MQHIDGSQYPCNQRREHYFWIVSFGGGVGGLVRFDFRADEVCLVFVILTPMTYYSLLLLLLLLLLHYYYSYIYLSEATGKHFICAMSAVLEHDQVRPRYWVYD